jgi:hypothetical protein
VATRARWRSSASGLTTGELDVVCRKLTTRSKYYSSGFKKPGKDGGGLYRAVLISGPPGIGKTTSAHLMAKAAGYTPIELNASDARSKKLIENATNIDNTSLDGFFQGKGMQVGDHRFETCLTHAEHHCRGRPCRQAYLSHHGRGRRNVCR